MLSALSCARRSGARRDSANEAVRGRRSGRRCEAGGARLGGASEAVLRGVMLLRGTCKGSVDLDVPVEAHLQDYSTVAPVTVVLILRLGERTVLCCL